MNTGESAQPRLVAEAPARVVARGLRLRHGGGGAAVRALDGVDVDLRAGEVVALTGPSGSGKTTLLSVLCGWEVPDAGTVVVHGPAGAPPRAPAGLPWSELAVLPQSLGLLADLTVRANLTLAVRLGGGGEVAVTRASLLLERLGLEASADRRPDACSLGQQQRAALARALVLEPAVLLADEPTAHQDAGWAEVCVTLLRERAGAGGTVLMATHTPMLMASCDRRITLADGRVVSG